MKPETLLNAMEDLDADLLLDAKQSAPVRRFPKRRLAALVTAAVLASTLIGTCFASVDGAHWFRQFFAQHSGETLTDGKNAYLGQSTAAFQQSYTKDGFTISLESALSDGVNTIIQFRVEVPEGTVLDAHHYSIANWDSTGLVDANGEDLRSGTSRWGSYDEDPSDSRFSMLYILENGWYEPHIDKIFGTTWNIRMEGIDATYWENLYTEEFREWRVPLVTGPWDFTVTLPESGNKELQFISEPVKTTVTMQHPIRIEGRDENGHIIPEYYQEDIVITSLRLRALSFAIDFQRADGEKTNADFDPFTIVMQDGSEVLVGTHHSGLLGAVGSGAPGRSTFNLESPIVLEEVDYLLLPDGTKLVPAR